MRNVPQAILNALKDPALPLKKQILLYRRVWNTAAQRYELETDPVDVTHLLKETGTIKLALDTDEVDKWDASNVSLTFLNGRNRFKEGLPGGLFESAVLWGSKVVYKVQNAGASATDEALTVFTGYIYTSPVFQDNGNLCVLTATSSLDALEYVSAEEFCLSKTDELAIAVTSQNQSDQGKEFATAETGVGYIDCVKYGATLQEAVELSLQADYTVSQLNEYAAPAQVKLKFTPTSGYCMWLSYRYWHKNMQIEDIVGALLDLSGISNRQIIPAVFPQGVVAYTWANEENTVRLCTSVQTVDTVNTFSARIFGGISQNGQWNHALSGFPGDATLRTEEMDVLLPAPGLFADTYSSLVFSTDADGLLTEVRVEMQFVDENGNGLAIYRNPFGQSLRRVDNYVTTQNAYYGTGSYKLGAFDLDEQGNIGVYVLNGNNYIRIPAGNYGRALTVHKIRKITYSERPHWSFYASWVWWSQEIPANGQFELSNWVTNNKVFNSPMLFFQAQANIGFKKWGRISALVTDYQNKGGTGQFYWADSVDGIHFGDLTPISLENEIPSGNPYLRVYYKTTSPYDARQMISGLKVSQYVTSVELPLVNCTGLTVGEAIAELAKMVGYEIGFTQEGVFFFRARTGTYTEVEITPHELLACENHAADVDNLVNCVSVEFGNFKTTVDDNTENKPRPHSIDTYGVHEKTISSDNFIPADNVDISSAVARANYEALSTPGYTVQVECLPKLELELGDKIKVSSKNAQLADPNWSDHTKFEQLPIWKRVFKIIGIELSVDKRKMVLNLKDVTTSADEPEETMYEFVYDFPINLGAKK